MIVTIKNEDGSITNNISTESVLYHSTNDGVDLTFTSIVPYSERRRIMESLEVFKNKKIDLIANNGVFKISFKLVSLEFNELQGRVVLLGEDFTWI